MSVACPPDPHCQPPDLLEDFVSGFVHVWLQGDGAELFENQLAEHGRRGLLSTLAESGCPSGELAAHVARTLTLLRAELENLVSLTERTVHAEESTLDSMAELFPLGRVHAAAALLARHLDRIVDDLSGWEAETGERSERRRGHAAELSDLVRQQAAQLDELRCRAVCPRD